jgi:hypothetical protein
MVKPELDLDRFAESVAGKELLDVIHAAEREATRAERLAVSDRCGSGADCEGYARCLKDLILYLRHGIRRGRVDEKTFRRFQGIRDGCRRETRPSLRRRMVPA